MPQTTRKSSKSRVGKSPAKPRRHCNGLGGRQWLKNSISVWSDIRKTSDEARLRHPAMFPQMLVERLLETFLPPEGRVVFDPFAGSGSTVVAAELAGRCGIGLEISPEYVQAANSRLAQVRKSSAVRAAVPADAKLVSTVHRASAADLLSFVDAESVDLCITSPPYWNILNQRRTADMKTVRHYGNLEGDLGTIEDYEEFLTATTAVFRDVLTALKAGAFCCVVVMDLRKKNRFFPLHSDLAGRMVEAGYLFDDLIIWNRQTEYNNLRPLGYPSVFRVNKVHEFVLLMQKPRTTVSAADRRRPRSAHSE
jgi:DNA modification methylase